MDCKPKAEAHATDRPVIFGGHRPSEHAFFDDLVRSILTLDPGVSPEIAELFAQSGHPLSLSKSSSFPPSVVLTPQHAKLIAQELSRLRNRKQEGDRTFSSLSSQYASPPPSASSSSQSPNQNHEAVEEGEHTLLSFPPPTPPIPSTGTGSKNGNANTGNAEDSGYLTFPPPTEMKPLSGSSHGSGME